MSESSDRPLAYVQTIQTINPIPGADAIDVATILGWHVIVKKGLYKPGDPVVYVEIDSIVPPWEYFLNDKLDRYNFRIKTITLRKQLSQGYCVPIPILTKHPTRKIELTKKIMETEGGELEVQCLVDVETQETIPLLPNTDLTNFIGIKKYEIQNSVNVNGKARGQFPSFIQKTDQPRIQNLPDYPTYYADTEWEVTEKLEGMSITSFFKDGQFGICSRNLQLDISPEAGESVAVKTLMDMEMEKKLQSYGKNIALQGELIGPGIQLNIYGLKNYEWKIFDIWLIDSKRYATAPERMQILHELGMDKNIVPVLEIKKIGGMTVDQILSYAEGLSVLQKVQREGIVFKSRDILGGRVVSFKAISNVYELKKAKS